MKSMKELAGQGNFQDGLPVASICTGWGVGEMVLDALNDQLQSMDPSMPKARLSFFKLFNLYIITITNLRCSKIF